VRALGDRLVSSAPEVTMRCVAGWIRFRASLMAMRRTSWIDHRINDEATMVLFLRWFGVAFFLAAAD